MNYINLHRGWNALWATNSMHLTRESTRSCLTDWLTLWGLWSDDSGTVFPCWSHSTPLESPTFATTSLLWRSSAINAVVPWNHPHHSNYCQLLFAYNSCLQYYLIKAAWLTLAPLEWPSCFTAVFFLSVIPPRCTGRSPWNFATWSEMCALTKMSPNLGSPHPPPEKKIGGQKRPKLGAILVIFRLRSWIYLDG